MKQTIGALIAILCIILIARHVVADNKQEERIIVLENEVQDLYKIFEETDAVVSGVGLLGKENNAHTKLYSDAASSKSSNFTSSSAANNNAVAINNNNNAAADNNALAMQRDNNVLAINKNNNAVNDGLSNHHTAKKSGKFTNPIRIELNTVDSATLIKIPGIAAKTATTIIRYRDMLGGFYSPRQLAERLTWDAAQEKMDEWCTAWFYADTTFIKQIKINSADFKQILRHPYITYEQTKAIVNYRNKHKKIESLEALRQMSEFTEDDIARLRRYIAFE